MIQKSIFYFSLIITFCYCKKPTEVTQIVENEITTSPPIEFDLEKILERGKILAAVENNSTGYFTYRGRTMGYEYELLEEFAKYLGVEFEIVITKNIEEAFELVNKGDVDIIAFTLTITKERKKRLLFADYQYTIRQVLVQRKPDNWRDIPQHRTEAQLIRNQVDLIGKEVHVRYRSSYLDRILNLSEEIGGDIVVIEENETLETEDLILKVAQGDFAYTISDEDIAKVNAGYYPILDVKTPVSFPTQIAWAVRLNAPKLRDKINVWQKNIKRAPTFNVIYNKYFESPRASASRKTSDYFSEAGGKISEYDQFMIEGARRLGWDWRLFAALVYRESKFDPKIKSWAGAMGLMQVMPNTGKQYGITQLYDPEQNIKAGTEHLIWLTKYFQDKVPDFRQRLPFVVASYNVGLGHVIDARNLTEKYGKDKYTWFGSVDEYMKLKSKPKYYNDPIVKYGYARGSEPVNYVEAIRIIYRDYRNLFEEKPEHSEKGLNVDLIQDVVN